VGRQLSRDIARGALSGQLGIALAGGGTTTLWQDMSRASAIARAQAADIARRAASAEGDALGRWTKALRETNWRASLAASTEPWHAAAAERERSATEAQAQTGVRLEKRWNAERDKFTCLECIEMDGQQVPLHEDFPDGLTPGGVHSRCRCWTQIVEVGLRKAA